MGVQGLWELLAPVGRRVSVETLAGRKLAIDASIWMIQFMKAMRDENGDMVRNAHILGFFRRICKLLFLRVKPVFVFDGGTPALKRRTIAARRRHRDNAQAKIRKTAERLLLNHIKVKKLEELAQEMKRSVDPNGSNGRKDANSKGKQVAFSDDENQSGGGSDKKTDTTTLTQEAMDEMLAASLAAEEEDFNGDKATSAVHSQQGEDDDEDDDEEMILPVTSGNIDPSVLASLPPSMQLDLLVQMRERLMAENRQKYQKIKKAPTKFSELQIQSYLKTVAFRREIDEVQKCAAGRGLGGVQSSRIASEANREFIFSSSFTGDKNTLSAKATEKNGDAVNQSMKKTINLDLVKNNLFTSHAQSSTPSVNKVTSDFEGDVETYRDENGRIRVSRVRGMGIRMTRDLQRNLDLMKEHEHEFDSGDIRNDLQLKSSAQGISETNNFSNATASNERNSINVRREKGESTQEGNHFFEELSVQSSKETLEISFLKDDGARKDTDDDLFLHLVSGTSPSALLSSANHSDRSENEHELECVWEEGTVGEKHCQNDHDKESTLAVDDSCEENEVEWEEGDCDVPLDVSHCQAELGKGISQGLLEEEADIQEAIRRSLQDISIPEVSTKSCTHTKLVATSENHDPVEPSDEFTFEEKESTKLPQLSHHVMCPVACTPADGDGHMGHPSQENSQKSVTLTVEKCVAKEDTDEQLIISSELDGSKVRILESSKDEGIKHHASHEEQHMPTVKQAAIVPPGVKVSREVAGNSVNMDFNTVDNALSLNPANITSTDNLNPANVTSTKDNIPANDYGDHIQASESDHSVGSKASTFYSKQSLHAEEKMVHSYALQEELMGTNSNSIPIAEQLHLRGEIKTGGEFDYHNVTSEANLDEEISLLGRENLALAEEQRKLERNAESVSSEMFAECQELLQMFGLPYIIAPMEAEAQCAYMEMLNLVDGVVTDDSDVFLFGARNVYKNIFDDRKYVETYFMKDIESELGLNRETLIRMALLLGSDYTEGVSGIGIVNAIEVVRAFPDEDGLQKFREWVESPDPSILRKLNPHSGGNSKKRSVKSSEREGKRTREDVEAVPSEENVLTGHEDKSSFDDILHTKEVFMMKHRNVSKNWHLPSSFPSESVITAYISPQVDDSTEPFMWGKPDLFLLRRLCWERFGWDNKKADELLVPVLKEYSKHETQLRLEAFYTFNERFAKIRSQRIKKAVKGISGKCPAELIDIPEDNCSSGKKRARGPSSLEKQRSETTDKCARKGSKKRRQQKTGSQNMLGDGDMVTPAGQISDRKASAATSGCRRGRARGRGECRGRGRARGRGKEEEELTNTSTEASSSDDDDEKAGMERHTQVPATTSELRRSTRCRKHVQYAEEETNMEVDDGHGGSSNAKGQRSLEQRSSVKADDVSDHELNVDGTSNLDISLSGDYLQSGGGFCMDGSNAQSEMLANAAEEGMAAGDAVYSGPECQPGHPVDDDSHSADYLQSGGGFCMDESEKQVDACHVDVGSVKEVREPDGLHLKESAGGNSPATRDVDFSSLKEDREGGGTDLGLRAIPTLRKKRRKA